MSSTVAGGVVGAGGVVVGGAIFFWTYCKLVWWDTLRIWMVMYLQLSFVGLRK